MSKELFRDRYCLLRAGERMEPVFPDRMDMRWIRNTYSAFCNTRGGTIVIGLVPEGQRLKAVGVEDPHGTIMGIMEDLDDQNHVNRNLLTRDSFRILDVEGSDVVVIEVPRASRRDRPVYVGSDPTNAYRRIGEKDVRMSRDDVESMIIDSITPSPDSESVYTCRSDGLNYVLTEKFTWMLPEDHIWSNYIGNGWLRPAGVLYDDGDEPTPTLAGLLMFGSEGFISQELPSYRLTCDLLYGDEEIHIDSHDGTGYGNLLDFRFEVEHEIDFFLETKEGCDNDGIMDCFMEIVMNAIINCDYKYGGRIHVEVTEGGIIVENSGTFRISPDILWKGVNDPRNRNLARLFRALGDVRMDGNGLERTSETCRKLGLNGPIITESFDPPTVTVRISFDEDVEDFNDLETRIIEMIHADDKISILKAASMLNVGKARVERVFDKLRESGKLERVGGTRGRWVLH